MNTQTLFSEFNKNGFATINDFLTTCQVNRLLQECGLIVENMVLPDHCSIFQTTKDQNRDDYFINSNDKISFFFEKEAVNDKGDLIVEKEKSLNKVGHALHWLNPVFKEVTFNSKIKNIFKALKFENPVVVQSMVIFKHPEIGGIVTPHQDSTFLHTDPLSTVGIWIPLVDVTLQNGCLWFIPGSHKGEVYQRYVKNPEGDPRLELTGEMPEFDESLYVPVEVKKGDCVVIHGSVIHKSGRNRSSQSRPIYTFHAVESSAKYSEKNWLQPSDVLPFPSLYSH